MNFRQKITLYLFLTIVSGSVVFAQVVDIPDPNLRAAIIDALKLPRGAHVTEEHMRQLTELDLLKPYRGVHNLSGLEFAINLKFLRINDNPISDLRPIAGLTNLKTLMMEKVPEADINVLGGLVNLEHFDIGHCNFKEINVVANFKQLKILAISENRIVDISPVVNLKQLKFLWAVGNEIEDITPLSELYNLRALDIYRNRIINHSPVDNLSLEHFTYDQVCETLPEPLVPRLQNRNYPVLSSTFGSYFTDKPQLSRPENMALHDLVFTGPLIFNLSWRETSKGIDIAGGYLDHAIELRDQHLAVNPNMIFLVDIRMRSLWLDDYPEDWPHWIKDADGNIVRAWKHPYLPVNYGLIDFTHPVIQDRIVQRALAVARCGLFDGVFFDWWNDHDAVLRDTTDRSIVYIGNEAEQQARDNILARIRAATRPDFLIAGNVGTSKILRTGPMINGGHMETVFPNDRDDLEHPLTIIEDTLLWLDSNVRQPRINMIDTRSIPTQSPFSSDNLRWVRALTTLSLTHSDGYFFIGHERGHYWYDFWDADLRQPVGEKGQLYEDIEGLYIREFTNGWAVYNHSGEAQVITLPEEVQGVASGLMNTEHALANLDGEMYLRIKPKNPADVNDDGAVNILDLTLVAQGLGTDNKRGDVNGDGFVNILDLVFVADQF